MEKTKKPTVAGVLDIITGAFGIVVAISMFIGFYVVGGDWGLPGMEEIPGFVPGLILAMGVRALLTGVLALIGGIFAVQRRRWGWALAGSIAAIFSSLFPLGVIATIFVAIAKKEFE
jgi:hypothetical protein